jgi:hypothetical protein
VRLSPFYKRLFGAVLFLTLIISPASGFSILAHEAIIDAEWVNQIKPLLLQKYPNATKDDLLKAHAYAYGGCLVADMGYMPFGQAYFTDLIHYVRSGDFVMTMINEAQNLNEYAFSLGALSHYMADKYGHSLATNRSVPLANPDLKTKFGDVVTYDDDHTSHSRMELAYDVIQVAKGHYATTEYHDFIGFSMAKPVLERAFLKTYGQDLNTIFPDFESTVATFRWGVRDLFPAILNNAWHTKKDEIRKLDVHAKHRTFKFKMSHKMFNKEFGTDYIRPDFKARAVAFLIRVLPKIGPLKKFSFKYPGIESENLFKNSMDSILTNYAVALHKAGKQQLSLANIDFDTGKPAAVAEYRLADKTYDALLIKLQVDQFAHTNPDLRNAILSFYTQADSTRLMVNDPENGKKVQDALRQIKMLASN